MKNAPLKLVLGLVCVSHLTIGIAGCLPGVPIAKLAALFYKASIELSPQMSHIIQMFGVYMLTMGILALFALGDPVKNRAITHGIIILLTLRVIQRIMFAGQAADVFGIPASWYWAQTAFFGLIALLLLLLRPKEA
ncbi:hypothetical protein ACFL1E_06170 [Candidatus Omnitrophota bacterium]